MFKTCMTAVLALLMSAGVALANAQISFDLPTGGDTKVSIYDVTGRLVNSIEGNFDSGRHVLEWNGRDTQGHNVAPGVYFARITGNLFVSTQKVIVSPNGTTFITRSAEDASIESLASHFTAASPDFTFDFSKVAQACWSGGVWNEFASVVLNPNTAPQSDIDAVVQVCWDAGLFQELLNVMAYVGWTTLPPPPGGTNDLASSEIVYKYSFKMANRAIFGNGNRIFSNGDIAFDPTTGTLWMYSQSGLQQISIPPDPGLDPSIYLDNPAACPVSDQVGSRFPDELVFLTSPAQTFGGFEFLQNGRLYLQYYDFYNASGGDVAATMSMLSNFTDWRGPWRVGPPNIDVPYTDMFHANKAQQIVLRPDPAWVVAYTSLDPNDAGASFRQRPGGAFGGGKGPHLYVWDGDPSRPLGFDMNGTMLMSYQGKEWDAGAYRNAEGEELVSGVWVYGPGFSTVIYGWTKGHMTVAGADSAWAIFGYDPAYHTNGPNFYGPDHPSCGGSNKGWKAWKYTPEGFMYDADVFGEVMQGVRTPRSLIPYYDKLNTSFMWRVPGSGDSFCEIPWFSGMAYDPVKQLIYILQLEAYQGGTGGTRWLPVIHVLAIER